MVHSRSIRFVALLILTYGLHALTGAGRIQAQAPLPPMDMEPVKAAIEKGVNYLRTSQNPNGTWGPDGNRYVIGYTCLAGLTLIECGVPNTDPSMKKAADVIRSYYPRINGTYETALMCLFLDRMKEPKDKKTIEYLAARLIAGQSATGGWGYTLPKLSASEADQMMTALKKLNPPPPPPIASVWERPSRVGLCIKMNEETRTKVVADPPKVDEDKKKTSALAALSQRVRNFPVFQTEDIIGLEPRGEKGNDPDAAATDNSCVHFAILGLWAARRSQVPVDRSFGLLTKRFLESQNSDGSWAYRFYKGGLNGSGKGSMTSVSLLGLAIGHSLGLDKEANDPGGRRQRERLVDGFVFLSGKVGAAVGAYENRPTHKDAGGLYSLWAMERVAVLYDLPTLNNKDWYRWGAEILVANQKEAGDWQEGGYPGEHSAPNTSMALMFLTRANLTNDVPRRTLIDPDELAKKVEKKAPMVKVDPKPEMVAVSAEEPPTEEEPPVVVPQPEKPKAATTKAETPAPPASPPKSGGGGWILIVVGVLVVGGLLAFLVYMKMNKEDEKPRKKKAKSGKPKVKARS